MNSRPGYQDARRMEYIEAGPRASQFELLDRQPVVAVMNLETEWIVTGELVPDAF